MSTGYIERSTAIINQIEGLELVPHAMRLLADGEPVAIERLAAAAGRPIAEVEAALGEQTSAELDADGRLAGLGLTLRPTPHRYLLDGRTGELGPVEEAFAVGRAVVTQVGWAAR